MLHRLLVFVALFGIFADSAVNLKEFCGSHYLNMLSEDQPVYETFKSSCTITLPFEVAGIAQAMDVCAYYSPFIQDGVTFNEEKVTCVYKSNIVCPSHNDHVIHNKCVRIVFEPVTFAKSDDKCKALKGDSPNSLTEYKLLKVENEHVARWVTVLNDFSTKTKGIWIDQTSKVPFQDESEKLNYATSEKKYINLNLDLSEGKEISSILYGKEEEKYFYVCEALKTRKFADPVNSNSPPKYFVTSNLYQPSDFLKDNMDGLKVMDDICKKINPNSMLAPGRPQGLKIKDPVYVSVRAKSAIAFFNTPNNDCNNKVPSALAKMRFDGIIHPFGNSSLEKTGVKSEDWATDYPMNYCSDVSRTAVVYNPKINGLMDIPPIGRYRIACVTGKQKGLKIANPCGKTGDIGPNGKCKCKENYVDITTMTELDEAKNHRPGDLCVSENPCHQVGDKHNIVFILDASYATHSDTDGFQGLRQFVLNAKDLISHKNDVHFVAYGGLSTNTVTASLPSGWSVGQFEEAVNKVLHGYAGVDTNIAGGFEAARLIVQKKPKQENIIIHIGDGYPTGHSSYWRRCDDAYDRLLPLVQRFISVNVVRDGENMRRWHTDGDYVDFRSTRYEDLNLANMQFLMRTVCPQQEYRQVIESAVQE